jgi:hypothetical protein
MRGMTVVDWFGLSQQQPNVEIIQKVNWERLIESMKSIIAWKFIVKQQDSGAVIPKKSVLKFFITNDVSRELLRKIIIFFSQESHLK